MKSGGTNGKLEFSPATQHHHSGKQGITVTEKTEKELRELIENPPEGSAIAKAKEFGVDLYSILENLKLTPAERLRRAAEETDFVRRLRQNLKEANS